MTFIPENTTLISIDEDMNAKLSLVVEKLLNTLEDYTISFFELGKLRHEINLLLATQTDVPPITKLENICTLLNEKSADSPIIRYIHHSFCSDLDALKTNKTMDMQQKLYLG